MVEKYSFNEYIKWMLLYYMYMCPLCIGRGPVQSLAAERGTFLRNTRPLLEKRYIDSKRSVVIRKKFLIE